MSTSRKLRVKLAKHRRSARKAARKEPELEPAESSKAETQASTKRGTVAALSALTGTQFVCFCHWLSGQKLFAHFRAYAGPVWHTETDDAWNVSEPREPPQQVGSVKSLAICLSHSPSEIWPNTHFVFIPQLAAPGKLSAKPPPPTLTARRRPHQIATPQALSTL